MSRSIFACMMFGFVVLLSNCSKEGLSLSGWVQVPVAFQEDLTAVYFADSLFGVVTGGTAWESGFIMTTRDGGQHWQTDTLLKRRMEYVFIGQEQKAFVVGQDACYVLESHYPHWQTFWVGYRWARACHFPDNKHGAVVSGNGYQNGEAYVTGPDVFWKGDTIHQVLNELSAVWFSDSLHVHAVGIGWVMRSDDAGHTWFRHSIEGDFFNSVHFPDDRTGYICGASGTLLKTQDAGQSWVEIRKGGSIGKRKAAFRSLWFTTPDRGWVVGDEGLIWQTENGGKDWTSVKNAPKDADFTRIHVLGNTGWVTGKKGLLFKFSL
jgi:photosystem II stability/assembly factor-like uncharacterized protein